MLGKPFSIFMALIFIGGCASVTKQHTPTFTDGNTGKKVNYTTVTITEVNAFAPTTSVKFVLQCEVPNGVKESLENTKCRPANIGQQATAPGVVVGFGSTVVNSAAIVGGSHLIGEGLKESGDRESKHQEYSDSASHFDYGN